METKERNNRIDCLRALSMFLIVVQHYVVWGVKPSSHAAFCLKDIDDYLNYLSMEALYLVSCIGVNCFIMISGYFMITKFDHRWKSLLRIWVTMTFYSLVIYLCVTVPTSRFSYKEIISVFFPVWSKQYWFVSTYLAVMLLSPFLSLMVNSLSKRGYQTLLLLMFGLCFMFPYGSQFAGGTSVLWMIFVFLTAGYIRLHSLSIKAKKAIIFSFLPLLFLLIFVFYVYDIIITSNSNMSSHNGGVVELHSFMSDSPIFFLSLSAFVFTINNGTKNTVNTYLKYFSKISPYVFAVYLIHMNHYLCPYIWNLFIPATYTMPMFVHSLISAFVIFVVCIAIDWLRSIIFKYMGIDKLIKYFSFLLTNKTSYNYEKRI